MGEKKGEQFMKKLFAVHAGADCNTPGEVERVLVVGAGVGIVERGGVHPAGSVKVTRYRRRQARIEPWYVYVSSVTRALFMLTHAVARGLRNGREVQLWSDVPTYTKCSPRSISGLDARLRPKHPTVQWCASTLRKIRRALVERTIRTTRFGRSDVWRAVALLSEPVNDLLQIIDAVACQLSLAQRVCDELLAVKRGEPTLTELPQQPWRDRYAQSINDAIAGLNQVRDGVYGCLARQIREALRTAHAAAYGIVPGPYIASLVHARDRVLFGRALLDLELFQTVASLRAETGAFDYNSVEDVDLLVGIAAHLSCVSQTGQQMLPGGDMTRQVLLTCEIASRAHSGKMSDVQCLRHELRFIREALLAPCKGATRSFDS